MLRFILILTSESAADQMGRYNEVTPVNAGAVTDGKVVGDANAEDAQLVECPPMRLADVQESPRDQIYVTQPCPLADAGGEVWEQSVAVDAGDIP
jgi:hypothetical protein